ncbi:pentatricopeptide repeat-containing protein At5g09450, mitochondrial-like [Primulina eburnea]|uniref:pentatricopeptide repeat-containing protein At5g09450, mitochondrial-like n=1 Tax=Primulina eburnea TaxID=1245227 RepID=UPI003C6C565A
MSFRPFSSSTEAVIIHGEKNADGCGEEEKKDDLRSRIFRVRLPKRSATYVLQKWVNEGREITVSELRNISRDHSAKSMTEEANLSLSAITHNELMTLYMSVGHFEKVPRIIEEMKRQNIEPDLFTYNLLVSSCAASLNIDEVSLDPGCNKSWLRYRKLADIYIISGRLTKLDAKAVVESEKDITQRELISYDFLLILHGGLGNKDKLDQIWKSFSMTRQKLTDRNYVCVLSSYLILGHLKEVGEIIDQWKKSSTPSFNSSMCSKLLEAFKDVGLTEEAKSFQKLLGEKGCVLMDEIQ